MQAFQNINNVIAGPHNSVLSLRCRYDTCAGPVFGDGTGFLIDNNVALTSAHVVYDWQSGSRASRIDCYIERSILVNCNVIKSVVSCAYPLEFENTVLECSIRYQNQNWRQWQNIQQALQQTADTVCHDYAILFLGQGQGLVGGIQPESYNSNLPKTSYDDRQLTFCGYPTEVPNKDNLLYGCPYEKIANLFGEYYGPGALEFRNYTYGGMSGSPIRIQNGNNDWNALAILSQTDRITLTYGCSFDEEKIDSIKSMKQKQFSYDPIFCLNNGKKFILENIENKQNLALY